MKKIIIKIIFLISAETIFVLLSLLGFSNKCVEGIAADSNNYFVAALELIGKSEHDLLFYDRNCRQIGSVRIPQRGGIKIGCADDILIVQNGAGSIKAFDFQGNELQGVIFGGSVKAIYSYSSGDVEITYWQDKNGDEYIEYRDENGTKNVDINYGFYKRFKTTVMLPSFFALNILMLACYRILKNTQKKVTVSRVKNDYE